MVNKAVSKIKYKIVPDWSLPEGKSTKNGQEVRIHPYALIRYAQKKWGIGKASEVAIALLKRKYNRVLEKSKVRY